MAILVNALIIAVVVLLHYEALRQLYTQIPRLPVPRRVHVLVAVFGALIAHFLEICVFALGLRWHIQTPGMGSLVGFENAGSENASLVDCIYVSFVNYTSLGYGEIVPVGPVRFLCGIEGLVGLVMIGWTASFIYIEMTRFWREPAENILP